MSTLPKCQSFTYDQQVEWAKAQGGDGILSVEESLYLLLRARVELGRIPFMGGWIRCRNEADSGGSLVLDWDADSGPGVDSVHRESADWYWGAVPRKFRRI